MGKAGLFVNHPAVPALGSYGPYCLFPVLSLNFFLLNKSGVGSTRPLPGTHETSLEGLGPEPGMEKGMVRVWGEETRGLVLQCLPMAEDGQR